MSEPISGKTLIGWGFAPGTWFKAAISAAEAARAAGGDETAQRAAAAALAPQPVVTQPLRKASDSPRHTMNIDATSDDAEERANISAVDRHMCEIMRLPTVVAGAVMPDACVSGSALGTIPVGGVVAAKGAIHPGMHSADICCSMALSVFRGGDPKALLDAGMQLSHFGGGGRPYSHDMRPSADLLAQFAANKFLATTTDAAVKHFGTQGDGNHFYYVGHIRSTGELALVTHHGSRRPGALLYKAGLDMAEAYRRRISPETAAHNAWIPLDTADGEAYWAALQLIRTWTKKNHFAIHDAVAKHLSLKVKDRFWNEHNFVFQRGDVIYHAKGATPAFPGWAADATDLTLIPMNMAEPILIARGLNADNGLGFSPHGAGRNYSRSAYMRRNAGKTEQQMMAEQTAEIDARFYCGIPDVSELPGAYKPAAVVRAQIAEYGLAEIADEVMPYGSIMAGDWQRDAPWRKKKRSGAG